LSEFRDTHVAGYDRARFEEYLGVVNLEAVDLEAVDLEAVDLEAFDLEAVDLEAVDLEAVDGRRARCGDCIYRLVNSK
jgi:uncharacterized protein YjbI with pentapeptide repeats